MIWSKFKPDFSKKTRGKYLLITHSKCTQDESEDFHSLEVYIIQKSDDDTDWYWMVCDLDGEEQMDYDDIEAQKYLLINLYDI